MRPWTPIAIGLCAALFVACGKSTPSSAPSSTGSATHTHSASSTRAEPAIIFGSGFTFDPDYRADGIEDFVTIRLGDRVRFWSRTNTDRWTPATLSLLDDEDTVLWSVRMDLPPAGAITAVLPETSPPWTKVRMIRAHDDFDSSRFDRCIGVPEPELTTERMREIGVVHEATDTTSDETATVRETSWSAAIWGHTGVINPGFATVMVHDGVTSYTSTTKDWGDIPRPIPDALWIENGLRSYLELERPSTE